MRPGWALVTAWLVVLASRSTSTSAQPPRVSQVAREESPEFDFTGARIRARGLKRNQTSHLRLVLGPRADEVLGQMQAGHHAASACTSIA